LAGSTLGTLTISAAADDSRAKRSQPAAAFSVGQQGNKLKWLPYRPSTPPSKSQSKLQDEGRVVPASYVTKSVVLAQAKTAQQEEPAARPPESPFKDPFGDMQGLPAPPGELPDNRLPGPDSEPPLSDSFPSFLPEGPDAAADREPVRMPEEEPIGERLPLAPIEESTTRGIVELESECPTPDDEDFFKPLDQISTNIAPPSEDELPPECTLGEQTYEPRTWAPTTFTWKASGLCHKPLYFEDVHLERYGHSWGPYLQPIISGGHFFLTIPVLPYKMGLYPPTECMYTLGYYRPGSCAPYLLDPLPISVRAGLAQAGVATGLVYALP